MNGFKISSSLLRPSSISESVAVAKIQAREVWVEQRQDDDLSFVWPNVDPTGIEKTDVLCHPNYTLWQCFQLRRGSALKISAVGCSLPLLPFTTLGSLKATGHMTSSFKV